MDSQSASMEFLLLEEVQFLEVKDDALFQWELVDVLDVEDPDHARHHHHQPDVDPHHHHDANRDHCHQFDDVDGYGDGDDKDDDDDDDDDGDDDLDDELVPWNVSNKFERQRMRKLGKRAFSKMQNSKRSPYLFVRPGCVRGKHGLGLKHND